MNLPSIWEAYSQLKHLTLLLMVLSRLVRSWMQACPFFAEGDAYDPGDQFGRVGAHATKTLPLHSEPSFTEEALEQW